MKADAKCAINFRGQLSHLTGIGVRLTRVEKIKVLDWGRSEMVVNSYLEDLDGRMRSKRMWKFIPQVRKRKNK